MHKQRHAYGHTYIHTARAGRKKGREPENNNTQRGIGPVRGMAEKHTHRKIDIETVRQTYRENDIHPNIQTELQAIHAKGQAGSRSGIQSAIHTGGQRAIQKGIQAETQTY